MVLNPVKILPKRILNELINKFKAEGIILFGSYAKKEERKNSDIDLLILSPHHYTKKQIINIEKDIKKKYGLDIDIWVMHPRKVYYEIINKNIALIKIIHEGRILQSTHHTSFLKKVSSRWMRKLKNG